MGTKTKSLAKGMAMKYDEGSTLDTTNKVIVSKVFKTDGMFGKTVMMLAEVTTEVVGAATTNIAWPTVQYSLDGVNFVDSPKSAITQELDAVGNKVAVGKALIFNVDMTNIIAPYMRVIWKTGTTGRSATTNTTAGVIKTSVTFSV